MITVTYVHEDGAVEEPQFAIAATVQLVEAGGIGKATAHIERANNENYAAFQERVEAVINALQLHYKR